MKAFVLQAGKLAVKEVEVPSPQAGEVLVALKVAGLNRRDLYIPNRVGTVEEALILGSDGAGIVEAVGKGVNNVKVGDEVIINPSLGWEKNSAAPPEDFDILGMPDNGTMAEKIVIAADQVEPKPAYLTWEEAGVLALSALTAYRALVTKGQVVAGQTVFIPGAGSGVATYLIQFAKKLGARVIVTSRSEEKRKLALKLGADLALDTKSDWGKELADETIDLVIDSVGRATFNRSLSILKQGGRMVVFGATTEDIAQIDLRAFFYAQQELLGSTMGSKEELKAMLTLMEEEEIRPYVGHVYDLENIQAAFDLLTLNDQFGKIAIKIDQSIE